jgi:hypothetical protein
MFSMHDISVWNIQIINERLSNIKLWNVKFMMYIIHKVNNWIIGANYKCHLWL